MKIFRFLTNDYEAKFRQTAFSESVRISHGQHLPPKFFQYLLFLYARDLNMSRLTCNIAILRLVCRFHFVGATYGPQEFIRNLSHFLSYSTSVILLL